jgi:hypothetical protein
MLGQSEGFQAQQFPKGFLFQIDCKSNIISSFGGRTRRYDVSRHIRTTQLTTMLDPALQYKHPQGG